VGVGHAECGAHPAERLDLEDDDVARLAQVHPQRVLRSPDHLVGGHPDVDPPAQRDQFLQRRARLLDVFEAEPVELTDAGDGGVDVPRGVGVDPDGPTRSEGVAHRLDPRHVEMVRLPGLGDLDLRRPAAGGGHDRGGALGVDGGHGHVDRHRRPHRCRPAVDGALARGGPPAAALGHVVVPERGELAPPGRAAHQDAVADVDAAEAGPHRYRPDAELRDARRARQPGGRGDHGGKRSSRPP
jgi:hypothetical protein